jgi:hypothetical protein
MKKMDGHEFNGTKFAVDPADQLVDNGAEILVFFDILSAGNGDLDQNYFTNPFRMFGEEDLESV